MKKLFLLIAIAFMAIQANAQAPSNGLVAYYNFENTLASHVPAHSFTNGTVSNLTYSSAGKVGSCANFLGSQALFNTTMIATGNLETNCTIAWWELRADPTPANGSTSFQMKEALTYSYFGTSACSGATFMDRYRIDFETLNGSFVNYKFTNHDEFKDEVYVSSYNQGYSPYEKYNDRSLLRGKLKEQRSYNSNGAIIKKSIYEYSTNDSSNIKYVKGTNVRGMTCSALSGGYGVLTGNAYKIYYFDNDLINEYNYTYLDNNM